MTQPKTERRRPKLDSIQALRALAACLVVFYHMRSPDLMASETSLWNRLPVAGYSGVDVFFVLSGFIIFYIHRADLGCPSKAAMFCQKRAVRIYPLYWIVVLLKYASTLVPVQRAGLYTVNDLLASMSLLPFNGVQRILSVSWSLTYELFFYGIFLVAIVSRRRFLPFALVVWTLAILVAQLFSIDQPALVGVALSVRNLGFILGIGVSWLFVNRPPSLRVACASGLLGALLFSVYVLHTAADPSSESWSPFLRSFPFALAGALMLYGLTGLEKYSRIVVPRALVFIGDASYSIYLTHIFFGSMIVAVLSKLPLDVALTRSTLVISPIAIAMGCLVYLGVEKPLLGKLKPRSKRPDPSGGLLPG